MGYEGIRTGAEPGGTGNIGVLVSDRFFDESTFYNSLYRSLVLSSGEEGLTCMLEIIPLEAEQGCSMPALITGRKVDGLILMGNLERDYLRTVVDSGLPCVLLDYHMSGMELDCVVSDNIEGGFTVTSHLLQQGRRDIAFVGSILSTSSIMDRYLGYQRAMREAGIVPQEDRRLEDRDCNGTFIPLKLPRQMPQAFVCSCDEVAYNLVTLLREAGVRVPQEAAVCGYDDFRFATLCQPQLTSYRVDVELMAQTAVSRLTARIRQECGRTMRYTVPGRLVVRESSAAAEQ